MPTQNFRQTNVCLATMKKEVTEKSLKVKKKKIIIIIGKKLPSTELMQSCSQKSLTKVPHCCVWLPWWPFKLGLLEYCEIFHSN